MKCLLGAVKSPLDKLTPSCRTLSDPFPALDRMLWFQCALKDTQVARTHRYKVFLSSAPTAACAPSQAHTFLVGNLRQLCTKMFLKTYFIPMFLVWSCFKQSCQCTECSTGRCCESFSTTLPSHQQQLWAQNCAALWMWRIKREEKVNWQQINNLPRNDLFL